MKNRVHQLQFHHRGILSWWMPAFVYEDNISEEMMKKLRWNVKFQNRFYLIYKLNQMNNYESLIDALTDLTQRGYASDFALETTCIYCGGLDLRLRPEEFIVDEVYRFEDDSTPDDSSVLYAISSITGLKGTLVDSYGVYSDSLSFEMAQKLKTNPFIKSN